MQEASRNDISRGLSFNFLASAATLLPKGRATVRCAWMRERVFYVFNAVLQ